MIIAVLRGMNSLKEQLEERGYKVVYRDEYSHPIDVYIHKGREDSSFSNVFTGGLSSNIVHGSSNYGSVMEINAKGKTIRDIEMMLFSKRHNNTDLL